MISKKTPLLPLLAALLLCVGCSKNDTFTDVEGPKEAPVTSAGSSFEPSLANDSLALISLYKALDGANWGYTNWAKTPLRYWQGVTLSEVNGRVRVTSVELSGNRMKGQLPAQIGMLTELKRLVIAGSDFVTGSIVDEVFELRNLRVLDLRFTELTGELSPRIGQLAQLDTLILWKSQFAADAPEAEKVNWERNTTLFSGSIPAEIGQLKKLRYLNLARAGFEGEIPSAIGSMSALTRLDLSENRLSGSVPASIGNLSKLEWLSICNNRLTGSVSGDICRAASLETLILSNNELTGSIPSEIGDMSKLNYFDVENNRLTGSIPTSIEQCSKLGIFYAGNNQLTGSIPAGLGTAHPWLVSVNLENNDLTGSLPEVVANKTGSGDWSSIFIVHGNKLNGNVPEVWMQYPNDARKHLLPQQAGYGFDNLK